MDKLENELKQDVFEDKLIPYIQKYEFEALVLANADLLCEELNLKEKIVFDHPEEINHNFPPSKRISKLSSQYIKPTHGIKILKKANWKQLRERCPRFDQWISKLENLKVK